MNEQEYSKSRHPEPDKEVSDKPLPVVASLSTPVAISVKAETTEQKSVWQSIFRGLEILGITAVVTYTILTYFLLRDTDRALKQTTEHFQIEERAWILLGPVKPELFISDQQFGTTFTCKLYPQNVGKTIATQIDARVHHMGGGEQFGSDAAAMRRTQDQMLLGKFGNSPPIFLKKNPLSTVLAPGEVAAVPVTIPCSDIMRDHLGRTQNIDYVVGRIDYCDQFRVRHWLKFCFYVANSKGDVWNCEQGNEADQKSESNPSQECSP